MLPIPAISTVSGQFSAVARVVPGRSSTKPPHIEDPLQRGARRSRESEDACSKNWSVCGVEGALV
jgi:hypothetical protein